MKQRLTRVDSLIFPYKRGNAVCCSKCNLTKSRVFSVFRRSSKTQDTQNHSLNQFSIDIVELAKPDKRFISGDRVVYARSLQFPKVDCFKPIQTSHQGCSVFNLRGGAFYTKDQFCDDTVTKILTLESLG